ncbi:hypothetical protein BSL78_13026 [Apostichopus japonicus]|uniref:Uncharacterized protein n=1 Tax=Stichopus japonicus TaxID=307972 RepID=A0A2G8KQ83_STIJA|nr:hypothetical protein BSL78_13026 [Apostichopus japonicus]
MAPWTLEVAGPGSLWHSGSRWRFRSRCQVVSTGLRGLDHLRGRDLGYSVAEFDTFSRHKIPVIAVVGNDACWTQILRDQEKIFSTRVACDLTFCDYDKVAIGTAGPVTVSVRRQQKGSGKY